MKINSSKLITLPLAGMLALSASSIEKSKKIPQPPGKPNIIIIIPDDLGWNDVGYHGSEIKTPNIDKLAKSGMCLNQYYVMPTCTPTRVSLMTGKYPSRYGITGPDYGEVIDLGDATLASILSNEYHTAIAGKWHLGSPPYTPLKYGFQSSYGYFDGQIDPYTHEYKMETELTERRSWHRNDEYLEEEGHVTDLLTAEAIRIIEGNHGKPFFLYLAHHVPHYPLDEPDQYMAVYNEVEMFPSRKLFAASVTHMDNGIGKIIDALERTNQRENTLIIFTSDNGGQHSWHSETEYQGKYAEKPHNVLGNNYPLRGWKAELYEGGIRVPAFVNWPGTIKPGITNIPVHVSDWLPTLCNLLGYQKRIKSDIDGRNMWPFLTGEQNILNERQMYWKTGTTYAVREGNWKLLVHRNSDTPELYNLENDFREKQNLSSANPDITKQMINLLEKFMKNDRE